MCYAAAHAVNMDRAGMALGSLAPPFPSCACCKFLCRPGAPCRSQVACSGLGEGKLGWPAPCLSCEQHGQRYSIGSLPLTCTASLICTLQGELGCLYRTGAAYLGCVAVPGPGLCAREELWGWWKRCCAAHPVHVAGKSVPVDSPWSGGGGDPRGYLCGT